MLVATIADYGYVNHNRKTGSVLSVSDLVYLLIKHSTWTDFDQQIWRITHNPLEGFYVSCYDDGFSEECKTIEELVETLKQLIEGEI